MRNTVVSLLLFLQAGCVLASGSIHPSKQVDSLFSSYSEGVRPGAAVMVIRQGEIVHSAGYGYADLENKVPITPDSVFRLGSVSKQFTAMAVARLADQGKLAYEDPVTDYVPGLSRFPGITIRHLLTHTSGLPDYYDEFDASAWEANGTIPANLDVIAYLAKMDAPLFEPGQRYEYSNPAYEVLPLIVEAVSGLSYAQYMQQEIFTLAGMKDSVIHDHHRPSIDRRVIGYSIEEDGFEINDDDPLNGITGSGSQFSSLNDFYQWDQMLYGNSLATEPTMNLVFSRALLNNGDEFDYGFGWRLDFYQGHHRIAHGGSWVGFRTAISRYPELALTVVVLMNFAEAEPENLADKVTDIYLSAGSGAE